MLRVSTYLLEVPTGCPGFLDWYHPTAGDENAEVIFVGHAVPTSVLTSERHLVVRANVVFPGTAEQEKGRDRS